MSIWQRLCCVKATRESRGSRGSWFVGAVCTCQPGESAAICQIGSRFVANCPVASPDNADPVSRYFQLPSAYKLAAIQAYGDAMLDEELHAQQDVRKPFLGIAMREQNQQRKRAEYEGIALGQPHLNAPNLTADPLPGRHRSLPTGLWHDDRVDGSPERRDQHR
jgi:hypothetical protein